MMLDKNKRYLMLTESPEKAKTITKIFRDEGYRNITVMATIGHFDKLADGSGYHNTGIHPEDNFKMDYIIDPDKKDVVNRIKEQAKIADLVLIASDPDREGEAIAWACVHFLKLPKNKYRRVTYQAINKKAIFEAIDNSTMLDDSLIESAHTRSCIDKGFGYVVSELLRLHNKGRSGGRVQSAALKMISDREKEIINFIPEKYIDLYLHFTKNNTSFKAKYIGTDKNPIKRLDNEEQVNKIYSECKGNPFIVKDIEYRNRFENPKPPFCTATFQQECANKLGLTVEEAQKCAQKLFDSGKISYHRTDSEIFEEDFTNELVKFVNFNYPKNYVSGTVVKGKNDENAQEGHEACHPLDLNLTPELFAKEESNNLLVKVYRIIYNRTVAAALKPAIIAQTTYNIYNKENKFVMNSNELKFDGYKCVYNYKDDSDEKEEIVRETFSNNEELHNCSFESIPKETTPPARYKESSFVGEMKKVGIGRPSTYDSTIKTIKSESRGYCNVENKYLKPTELGMKNIEFLEDNFPELINVNYTREMEKDLDLIAQGKLDSKIFLKEFFDKLDATTQKMYNNYSKCPICGSSMILRKGKFGSFYGCSKYPKCNGVRKIGGNNNEKN